MVEADPTGDPHANQPDPLTRPTDLEQAHADLAVAHAALATTHAQLRLQQSYSDALLESIDVGIISCEATGGGWLRNRTARSMMSLEPPLRVAGPEDVSGFIDALNVEGEQIPVADYPLLRALRGEMVAPVELLIGPRGGPHRTVIARAAQVMLDGEVKGAFATLTDITEEVASTTFFRSVLNASPDFSYLLDVTEGRLTFGSRSHDPLGYPVEQLKQFTASELRTRIHPDDRARVLAANIAVGSMEPGEVLQVRARGRHLNGEWVWLSQRITPFRRDATGRVTEVLGVSRDITDVIAAETYLTHAALHDDLTGLPNRALLIDRIEAALARATHEGREVAVMYCDLDGFKRINDTAGHATGDEVLLAIAQRLQSTLREHDTVARVGGDEFVIVIEPAYRHPENLATHRANILALAGKIAETIRGPILVGAVEHVVTASIGVTYAQPSLGIVSASDVLQDADAAMYRAKGLGKDRYEVFEDSLRTELVERGRIEQILRRALGASPGRTPPAQATIPMPDPRPLDRQAPTLVADYQPVFSREGALMSFEALARLTDSTGTLIPPDAFVGVAEDTGLIRPLGVLMLELACGQLASWRREHPGMEHITMAVNVSALQAQHSSLGSDVRGALSRAGLQPRDLVLELTETALLQAVQTTMATLIELRAEGVGIAIDDFGTGYASLLYLTSMPVSSVKIDRSFTNGLPDDETCRKIVYAVAGLAADLDLACVVEGVETAAQRDSLPAGVQLQGYLTGRPLAPDQLDVRALLASDRS